MYLTWRFTANSSNCGLKKADFKPLFGKVQVEVSERISSDGIYITKVPSFEERPSTTKVRSVNDDASSKEKSVRYVSEWLPSYAWDRRLIGYSQLPLMNVP